MSSAAISLPRRPKPTANLELGRIAHLAVDISGPLAALSAGSEPPDPMILSKLTAARRLLESVEDILLPLAAKRMSTNAEAIPTHFPTSKKLNLASGENRLSGWINLDIEDGDFSHCLQWPLPLGTGSIDYVFFAHALEHLSFEEQALRVLCEVRRVLSPRGVARIVVPDIDKFIRASVRKDRRFFELRRKYWPAERELETPLSHILSYSGASAPPHSFFGHKWGYDFETLQGLLRKAGFSRIQRSEFMQSAHPALRIDEASAAASIMAEQDSYSLFVEAMP